MTSLTSWGKFPVVKDAELLHAELENVSDYADLSFIPRGAGKSFGDCALAKTVLCTNRLNHIISFDETTGLLTAEAGVTLSEVLGGFLSRGWFFFSSPGTRLITLGGAFASDVHGKDHHVNGTFSEHVKWIDLWTPALGVIRCSRSEHEDLFWATAGGMGLTGVILRIAVFLQKVPSAYIKQEIIKTTNLENIIEIFENYNSKLPFSVAWIDSLQGGKSLGRAIFMGGRFAHPEELPPRFRKDPYSLKPKLKFNVPFDFPSFTLNRFSVKLFNSLYYLKTKVGHTESIVDLDTFFYPLDSINNWNRIYGRNGYTEFQFVVPTANADRILHQVLSKVASSGLGSFLTVLKLFGKGHRNFGSLSFPSEGYTLALDFKICNSLFPLLNELDRYVVNAGGQNYLSKDCRLSASTFKEEYGKRVVEFLKVKAVADPACRIRSMQSDRLELFF